MKPLTIEQLKALEVGDWVWYIDLRDKNSFYVKKNVMIPSSLCMFLGRNTDYSDYGTKWLAYKNKEQAEAEEYKIDFDANGGWEVRKYIPAHYQPWFTEETKEEAERRLSELKGK